MFSGRRHELDALDGVLDHVTAEGARVVLVEGPAGIGKTAVLHRFVERHPDLRVFWWSGEEARPNPSFAMIGRLFRSVGVRGSARSAHSARSLPEEAASRDGPTPVAGPDRARWARPLALVIDDAHAADLDSLRALLFALRRLSGQPVDDDPNGTPRGCGPARGAGAPRRVRRTGFELPIGPMLPAEVQDLAAAVGVPDLPLRTAYRMCAHTLGNPRHLVALLAELPVEAWSREMVLPAPRLFSRSVGRTLSSCADAARRLVEAVSVLGEHADLSTAAAIADVDEPLVALEEACRAGLLTTPHPTSAWHLAFPDRWWVPRCTASSVRPASTSAPGGGRAGADDRAARRTTDRWQPSDRWRTANSASAPGDEVPQVPAELVGGFLGACRDGAHAEEAVDEGQCSRGLVGHPHSAARRRRPSSGASSGSWWPMPVTAGARPAWLSACSGDTRASWLG